MSSSRTMLSLYKEMLREAGKIVDYNYRYISTFIAQRKAKISATLQRTPATVTLLPISLSVNCHST